MESKTFAAAPYAPSRYRDRKSTRLNSSHGYISYAVFCLKNKKKFTSNIHTLPCTNCAPDSRLPLSCVPATSALASYHVGHPPTQSSSLAPHGDISFSRAL